MLTKQNVVDAKSDPIATCDAQLVNAAALKTGASPADSNRIDVGMTSIRAKRTAIAVQDYVGALNDPAFQDALNKIQSATDDMNTTAQNMATVTGFITNVAAFVGGAGKVVSALQGA